MIEICEGTRAGEFTGEGQFLPGAGLYIIF